MSKTKKASRVLMTPAARFIMHTGKVNGHSLEEVNATLAASGLDPVNEKNWRFIGCYVPMFKALPHRLLEVCVRPSLLRGVIAEYSAMNAPAASTPDTVRSLVDDAGEESGERKVA